MPDKKEETTKSQSAFSEYCAMGPDRSLAKLCQVMGKSAGYARLLEKWSSDFDWKKRAKEYDAQILQTERDRKTRVRLEAIDEMNWRQANISKEAQDIAMKRLAELMDTHKISAVAAVQLLKTGIEAERKALDIPDQKIEVSGKDGDAIQIITTWGTPKVGRKVEDE